MCTQKLALGVMVAALAAPLAHGMDAPLATEPAPTPIYTLVDTIRPRYAHDSIVFVKKIYGDYLVVFDRKGRGNVIDIHSKTEISELWLGYESCLDNIFCYKDSNGQLLLVATKDSNKTLYLYNLTHDSGSIRLEKLYVGHAYEVYQNANDELIMVNTEDGSHHKITPQWQDIERQKKERETVLFDKEPCSPGSIKDEGLCVTSPRQQCERLFLSDSLFDIASLTAEQQKLFRDWYFFSLEDASKLIVPRIGSYHEVGDTLYCGHSGIVTVWKRTCIS